MYSMRESRCMSLLPRTTLHSDSEQYTMFIFKKCQLYKMYDVTKLGMLWSCNTGTKCYMTCNVTYGNIAWRDSKKKLFVGCQVVDSISARQSTCRELCRRVEMSTQGSPAVTTTRLWTEPWRHRKRRSTGWWCFMFLSVPNICTVAIELL
jgi:hypothetical protein